MYKSLEQKDLHTMYYDEKIAFCLSFKNLYTFVYEFMIDIGKHYAKSNLSFIYVHEKTAQ